MTSRVKLRRARPASSASPSHGSSRRRSAAKIVSAACAVAAFSVASLAPAEAHAQRRLAGYGSDRGHLVFDQLSGFRASLNGGISYYAPLGIVIQNAKVEGGTGFFESESKQSTTTFFLAPSVDYFVINHLSVGGHLELTSTSGSLERTVNGNIRSSVDLPNRTSFVLLPRVGWMFDLSERWGIWPRGGIGFTSQQELTGDGNFERTVRASAVLVQVDCGFLYRFNESFFLRMAPETSVSLGGSRSLKVGNQTNSVDASFFQFGLTAGFGGMLDLL